MPRILLSASFPVEQLLRQTPGANGHWEDFQFVRETSSEPVDGWVVIDDIPKSRLQLCPPSNTLLLTSEPESIRRYRRRFTGQFAQVWTTHTSIQHPHRLLRNEGQPWHYGLNAGAIHPQPLQFDDFLTMQKPTKQKLLSVICSNKAVTPDHRKRLEFVASLKAAFGDQIDVFGRGIRDMDDKSEAILPYKYHIVLENDHSDYFMTEKIADAFLGWSYPIYFGGSEAYHRFPEGSFTAIDIYDTKNAILIIRDAIANHTAEGAAEQVDAARTAVLWKNNIMAMLAEYWRNNLVAEMPQEVRLLPKSHRTSLILRQVGRRVGQPFSRRVA